jgi:glycerate-2-kinase
MLRITNREALLSHAASPLNRRAREIALDVIEQVRNSVDPRRIIRSKVVLRKDQLSIDGNTFDLNAFKKIFVLGGGKASGSMAEGLEEVLGDRIEEGLVVVPRGTENRHRTSRIKVQGASHPLPDESSVEAAKRLMELADRAEEDDLVLCPVSGGGSSLMALPREGVSLSDKQKVTELLLKSGATINEINAVRKHLSSFKGGQLAKRLYPATVVSLLLSDVVGDRLDVIASGPTVTDSTTFGDAISVLKRYDLWERAPETIRRVLYDGSEGRIPETPKSGDATFQRVHNIIIGNNRLACSAAVEALRRRKLKTLFLTSFLEGEARGVGFMLGALAREIASSGNPLQPPLGIVVGGETTVTVTGGGRGGRNQEIALGAALKIDGLDNAVIASISTDGIDGVTEAAGAMVDGETIQRSKRLGLDAREYLKNNDSFAFFSKLGGCLIYTGLTGTNVNDLTILIAPWEINVLQ